MLCVASALLVTLLRRLPNPGDWRFCPGGSASLGVVITFVLHTGMNEYAVCLLSAFVEGTFFIGMPHANVSFILPVYPFAGLFLCNRSKLRHRCHMTISVGPTRHYRQIAGIPPPSSVCARSSAAVDLSGGSGGKPGSNYGGGGRRRFSARQKRLKAAVVFGCQSATICS